MWQKRRTQGSQPSSGVLCKIKHLSWLLTTEELLAKRSESRQFANSTSHRRAELNAGKYFPKHVLEK